MSLWATSTEGLSVRIVPGSVPGLTEGEGGAGALRMPTDPSSTATVTTEGGGRDPLSTPLGPIAVDATQTISIPYGLFGFAGRTRFVVADVPEHDWPFQCLQSTEVHELGFLVVTLVDDRLVRARDLARAGRRAGFDPEALVALAIVTLRTESARMRCTVNLQAPILIDRMRRVGMQHVFADGRYDLHHVLHLEDCPGSAGTAVLAGDRPGALRR